jgi:hypothetical protein
MKVKETENKIPFAAAIARIAPLSDGKMGASVLRSARIIAVMAAMAFWGKLN